MATVDEDLNQIERDIRTLKIEYEQFFGGGRKRPPTDTQWRVDSLVRRLNERINEFNFAQRFRLNNLSQTYAKYQDMWRKKTAQKETGATQHHLRVRIYPAQQGFELFSGDVAGDAQSLSGFAYRLANGRCFRGGVILARG